GAAGRGARTSGPPSAAARSRERGRCGVRGAGASLLRGGALLPRGRGAAGGGLLRRSLGALLGELLDRDLLRDLLDLLRRSQRHVGGAVGDVRAEAAVLDDDRLLRGRVRAELLERGLRRGAAAGLGLGVDLLGLLEGDREDLLLRLQRAGVGALLQVRAVAAVLGGDLGAVRGGADHARQAQQLQRVLERDGREVHRLQQRAGAGPRQLR